MTPKDAFYAYILSMVGIPYIWGGNNPAGFDCSGLCIEILKSIGLVENHYDSNAQGIFKDLVNQKRASVIVQPLQGSLVFFGKSVNDITHIGFCISSSLMIEAGGGDSTCTSPEIAFKKGAFVKLRPINHRQDVAGFLQPNYSWS